MTWTIEPHGKGYALYSGRDDMHHGMNLVYLSEPDANWEQTKAMIEAVPDLLRALKRARETLSSLKQMPINRDFLNHEIGLIDEALKKARGEQ